MRADIEVFVDDSFERAEHAFQSSLQHVIRNHAEEFLKPSCVNVTGFHCAERVGVEDFPVLWQV